MSTDIHLPDMHLPKDLVVRRRLLKVERVVGEDTVTEAVEAQIQLPFKVIKIFDVIATVMAVTTEVVPGGVQVSGVIDKQLFVVDKGDLVRHIPEEVPFTVFVPIAGALPGMNVQVNVRVLTVDTDLVDPATVRQVIILEIFVKVTVTEQIRVVVDVRGRDITVEKRLLKVDVVVGEDTVRQPLTTTVTLPITARKIFRIIPTVRDVTAEVRQSVVIVRGIIHKQIFLVDEGDLLRHAAEDIPFTKTVPIPGAEPGQHAQVNVNVILQEFALIDPPSRQLRQDLVLEIFVKVTKTVQIDVVVNVTGMGIVVRKRLLKVESVVLDLLQRETVRATVTLPIQAIKIFEVIGQLVNVEGVAGFDTMTVRGILHKQIFFVDPSNLVRHVREDIPFRFVKAAPGARPGMNVQVHARIIGEIIARLINDKRVEQTAVIEIFVKVTETVQLEVVVDVRRVLPSGEEVEASIIEEE
ncbi:MAG: DUF3794 domain-containing protein [Bacillota bacterium]